MSVYQLFHRRSHTSPAKGSPAAQTSGVKHPHAQQLSAQQPQKEQCQCARPGCNSRRGGLRARTRRRVLTFIVLIVALIGAVVLSASIGQYEIAIPDVIRGFFSHFGIGGEPADANATQVLWKIRFPRIALGLLVGAALAVSGAIMQAIFSNPLAEPGIIGVSSGCAVGASIAIVVFPYALGGFAVPLAAFCSGLIASAAVYLLSRSGGRADVITLVLTGIAVTAVCSALTSIATYVAPTTARDQIVFWQMGSLNGASWAHVLTVAIITGIGLLGAISMAWKLDTLALGEKAAGHVGVSVHAVRVCAIGITALMTAAAVSYAGVIAFVGLIVPHVLRLLIGPMNKYLLPGALLGGALLITLSDLAARTVIPFADLPIGIFTALVGGPTFFILLRRGMRGMRRG
ncbi:FecCD family ABC transporter permease [Trueperella sp. LYQ143]|uniref:FecCD family ABC transporter permease n=1 Tax=Trueperella sp. LYQ143 TaxID=3391059 RepID=UPI003982F4E5